MSHKTPPEIFSMQFAQRRLGPQGAPDGAAEQVRRVAKSISVFGFIACYRVDVCGRVTPVK